MARRKKRVATAVDDVMRGCLERLHRCDVTAVGVLADHMEENRIPYAAQVRSLWSAFCRHVAFWSDYSRDVSRMKWTRREGIAHNRRWLWERIVRLFGKKWKCPPLEKFE